uniref:Uncharacterized protein n=1 Tax=Mycena chlorophos TaxID=658473 RepID=A0ABQ0KU72_MYCCL|nr:predicted protein [Mycena chlorophos]
MTGVALFCRAIGVGAIPSNWAVVIQRQKGGYPRRMHSLLAPTLVLPKCTLDDRGGDATGTYRSGRRGPSWLLHRLSPGIYLLSVQGPFDTRLQRLCLLSTTTTSFLQYRSGLLPPLSAHSLSAHKQPQHPNPTDTKCLVFPSRKIWNTEVRRPAPNEQGANIRAPKCPYRVSTAATQSPHPNAPRTSGPTTSRCNGRTLSAPHIFKNKVHLSSSGTNGSSNQPMPSLAAGAADVERCDCTTPAKTRKALRVRDDAEPSLEEALPDALGLFLVWDQFTHFKAQHGLCRPVVIDRAALTSMATVVANSSKPQATNSDQCYTPFGIECIPGYSNAYISWINKGAVSWTLFASGPKSDSVTQISARAITSEPMYLIMNLRPSEGLWVRRF